MSDTAGPSSSTSNTETPPNPRKRKYGNSCTACRQKKRSCDGQRPRCSNCVASDEIECIIPEVGRPLRRNGTAATIHTQPNAPPMSIQESLARLTEHMSRVEQRLHHIERGSQDPSEGYTQEVEAYHRDESYEELPRGMSSLPSITDFIQPFDGGGTAMPVSTIPGPPPHGGPGGAEYRLTTDESGNITYHGVTGLNSGPDIPISPSLVSQTAMPAVPIPSLAESVSQNQALAPIFQALAASKHISVAPELGDALLSAFHCYEVFEITEPASFLRDMVLGGPCYSELLLMVLYASASRMIDGLTEEQKLAQGDLFVKLAKAYLWKEMDGPTKITTIQSLLLLSSRECALGEVSQGWNHAGLAFRMIQDLGIHHHPDSVSGVSNLSLEEQAVRDRLFWAAFIWDKTLSLALGREPTLGPRPGGDPSAIPDFSNDDEPWIPYFVHPLNCPASLQGYVYPRSSRSIVFRLLARLCVIVHDIMMGLYGTESRDNVPHVRAAFVAKTQKRMDDLWHDVPAHLDPWPETFSPPPHVFMFLTFIHASYILLNRPIVSSHDISTATGPAAVCLQHSIEATGIAVRFTKTFGDYMRYLPRYSWFVAASFDIVILDSNVHAVQEAALDRLSIWLRTMTKNLLRAPSMRKSVQHISSKIYEALVRNPTLAQSATGTAIFAHLRGQRGLTGIPSPMNGFGNEGFGFFELLQNT